MYIVLRRTIAFAELLGLPRASKAMESRRLGAINGEIDQALWHRAEVWESVCAVDRIMAMMWSMPLGTPNSALPKRALLDADGKVVAQSFLYHLVEIASRVLELDGMYSSGMPDPELFSTVMGIDQEIRYLAMAVPKSWWWTEYSALEASAILQYWHQYLTVRAHLQLALMQDHSQQFAFNFATCLEASQELSRRYAVLRPLLPVGFFASRVIDLQAFTGAVFLFLASHRHTTSATLAMQSNTDAESPRRHGQRIIDTMQQAADAGTGAPADFARQAAAAIRSLAMLLSQPQAYGDALRATLRIPLIGKIHVSRKGNAAGNGGAGGVAGQPPIAPSSGPLPVQQFPNQTESLMPSDGTASGGFAPLPMQDWGLDQLSYSMEIPESFYPFANDDIFANEQWLTWN